MSDESILVINTGSSSLKLGLYTERDGDEQILFEGLADGVGRGDGKLELRGADGGVLRSEKLTFSSQHDALREAVGWLRELSHTMPCAIGHRVVHGGPKLLTHQRITPEMLQELRARVHFAPLHIPSALQLIEAAQQTYPDVPEFACFDTAFHATMPEMASRLPLPRAMFDEGIRRYGFHGLSYESIIHQLAAEPSGVTARIVIAHLGSGASLAAIKDGCSVDTSMGLTPTGGIPMATRTGDLDPGVLLYLLRSEHATADSLEKLLNRDSGLKALSGGKADMRELESAAEKGDSEAELAIGIFCRAIRKTIASYAAVLEGIDLLVFAGGIGEHSVRVRHDVCSGLGFLGVALDEARNRSSDGTISRDGSSVGVRIVASEEDRQIARHCRTLMKTADQAH